MSIPAIMIREDTTERRREERWRLRLGARWLGGGPDAQPITIINLSHSGLLIEVDHVLPVGTCLVVEMPGGLSKLCKTVWSSGNFYGGQFSEPLSVGELEGLLSTPPMFRGVEPAPAARHEVFVSTASDVGMDKDEKAFPFAKSARLIAGFICVLWTLLALELWFGPS